MSVEELRARITDISAQIAAQKKSLKKLEKDKSLVQRQLNEVLDPVARLAFDLSSDIFLRSSHTTQSPASIVRPCYFYMSALTRIYSPVPPALWQSMKIDLSCADSFKEGLLSWFPRPGNRLLSISLHGQFDDRGVGQRVGTAIWQHCPRLKHLELCDEASDLQASDFGFTMMDLTRAVALGPLPCLETLTIRGGGGEGHAVQGTQILDVLRLAPNVVECTLDRCKIHVNDERTMPEQVTSLVLRRLRFGASGKEPDSHDGILKYLSLPVLELLSLAMRKVSGYDLISFLKRSSPPLQELALSNIYNVLPLADFSPSQVRFFPDIAKETVAALGELEVDGMRIEIGTEDKIVTLSA
ncbi:hypothetical protein C8R47DRAFT_1206042 [Mycena vitilis]|nr:hypothetical protein C8R47DRAFT_1206042 [Mycena vitilis]